MDILCKTVIIKLLKRRNQDLIFRLYQLNCCRNVNTLYEMGISTINPTYGFKDVCSSTESTSLRQALNKYMCKLSSISSKSCWKCGKNLSNVQIFCDKCSTLQQVNKCSNYFEIIGIEQSYNLNLPELSKKYRQLQSVLHPDKFGNKSKEEKSISEEYSAIVNKAYSTLLHPLERGLYMLKLNGLQIEEGSVQMDQHFLMEIMEINEEIENETDPKQLNKLNETNRMYLNSLARTVDDAFKKEDTMAAKEILTKMKYYASIEEKIKELKQKLGIPD